FTSTGLEAPSKINAAASFRNSSASFRCLVFTRISAPSAQKASALALLLLTLEWWASIAKLPVVQLRNGLISVCASSSACDGDLTLNFNGNFDFGNAQLLLMSAPPAIYCLTKLL